MRKYLLLPVAAALLLSACAQTNAPPQTLSEKLEGKKPKVSESDADKGDLTQPEEGADPSKAAIKDDKQKDAGNPDKDVVADKPGEVTNESKKNGKPAIAESQVVKGDRVGLSVRSVNESVELVRRLSPVPVSK